MTTNKKIAVVPKPADLTYEFFEKPEKVGICYGDIFENDRPIGHYYSNTFFDYGDDLELYIGLKTGKDAFLIVAVRCEKGSVENYRAVDPKTLRWEFNDSLDFNHYTFLQPEEIANDEEGLKAYSLIQEVIYTDEGIFEYLDGNEPAYSVCHIGNCGQIGLITQNQYPFNCVMWSLQLLALSASEMNEYVDNSFGEIEVFYEVIGTPLEAHILDCHEWLWHGRNWNEWIHSTNFMDRNIENDFYALTDKFEFVLQEWIFDMSAKAARIKDNTVEFMQALCECRLQAQKILDKLGWSDRNPIMSSTKLLSEYSWDR